MLIEKNSKLVFIGDSITDAGRGRPVGEGFAGMGNGYVSLINSLLNACLPGQGIRVVNMGISGNTIRDLKSRWQTDLFDLEPDYVAMMIGVNDCWRKYDHPLLAANVGIDEFKETYIALIEQTLPRVKGMILMTPFFLEPNRQDKMRADVDKCSDLVRALCARYGLTLADVQAQFDQIMEGVYPMSIASDRVHPGQSGQMVIAKTFLQAIDAQIFA